VCSESVSLFSEKAGSGESHEFGGVSFVHELRWLLILGAEGIQRGDTAHYEMDDVDGVESSVHTWVHQTTVTSSLDLLGHHG